MATRFRRSRAGITAELEPGEVRLLDTLFADVAELLADPNPPSLHPMAVELGLADVGVPVAVEVPRDAALARLLPDANREDSALATEFRRFSERGLRRGKLEGLALVRSTLAEPQDPEQARGHRRRRWRGAEDDVLHLRLDDAQARAWAIALTDLRLVLADRLGIATEEDADALHERVDAGEHRDDDSSDDAAADPADWLAAVYDFVTWLQETLSGVLLADQPAAGDGRRPPPPGIGPGGP